MIANSQDRECRLYIVCIRPNSVRHKRCQTTLTQRQGFFSGVPHTLATFVSTCSVTSLDWLPNSDRHFVYGTSNGTVRLCDADERKVITEMSTSRETGNGSTQSIQQLACSPNNGSVIAISAASNGDSNSEGKPSCRHDLKHIFILFDLPFPPYNAFKY